MKCFARIKHKNLESEIDFSKSFRRSKERSVLTAIGTPLPNLNYCNWILITLLFKTILCLFKGTKSNWNCLTRSTRPYTILPCLPLRLHSSEYSLAHWFPDKVDFFPMKILGLYWSICIGRFLWSGMFQL